MSELGGRMRAARDAADVSLSSMAARTHYSKTYLWQLEAGERAVKPEHVTAYATALGIPVDALYGSPLEPLWTLWDARDDLPGDEERDRVTALLDRPRSVDRTTLATLADVLAVVRRLEDDAGAEHVIPMVDAQVRLVEQFADEARSGVRPVAVGLLSELEQYRGWLAIPGKQWRPAGAHLDRAAVLALEIDDPLRLSTALSFSAYRAIRRRKFRAADALSDAARRDTRVHLGLRTYETFQRAEILAHLDEHAQALRLLSDTDHMIEHLPPADELPPSGYWYTAPFFLGQRAFVLNALGDHTAAGQAARDCLTEMPPAWTSSEWASRRRELAALT